MFDEIRAGGTAAIVSGSCERLIAAVANKKKEGNDHVPDLTREWRARQESNL